MVRLTDGDIQNAIRALAIQRGIGKSLCPSEVARDLSDDWRALMPRIRELAAGMDDIEITQKGAPVELSEARGPIRLALR